MREQNFKIGDRVRVTRHWLRSGHAGTIIDCELKRSHIWLVEFDVKYSGGGFDDGGKLYMDDVEIEPLREIKRKKAA